MLERQETFRAVEPVLRLRYKNAEKFFDDAFLSISRARIEIAHFCKNTQHTAEDSNQVIRQSTLAGPNQVQNRLCRIDGPRKLAFRVNIRKG